MGELVLKIISVCMCFCLVLSMFLTILPNSSVGDDDFVYKAVSLKTFIKVCQNAPLIDLEWISKNIRVEFRQSDDYVPPSKPQSIAIQDIIKWAIEQVVFNSKVNTIFNDYILLPIKCIMWIWALLINMIIFVSYALGVLFGFIPLPA